MTCRSLAIYLTMYVGVPTLSKLISSLVSPKRSPCYARNASCVAADQRPKRTISSSGVLSGYLRLFYHTASSSLVALALKIVGIHSRCCVGSIGEGNRQIRNDCLVPNVAWRVIRRRCQYLLHIVLKFIFSADAQHYTSRLERHGPGGARSFVSNHDEAAVPLDSHHPMPCVR